MEWSTATPSQIDEQIFANLQLAWAADDRAERELDALHVAVDDRKVYGWSYGTRTGVWQLRRSEVLAKAADQETDQPKIAALLARYRGAVADAQAASDANRLLQAEYVRRGGWTRAYLVDNADGHVHRSTNCSTWRASTRYHWLTELSGHAESEIVELAGERACTVCYPTAPVDVLKRPSKLEGPAQRAAREAAEHRAAEKAVRDAKRIEKAATRDGSPLVISHHGAWETFRTEQSATNWLVGHWFDAQFYGWSPVSEQTEATILAALADKHDVPVYEIRGRLQAKLAAKAKREKVG